MGRSTGGNLWFERFARFDGTWAAVILEAKIDCVCYFLGVLQSATYWSELSLPHTNPSHKEARLQKINLPEAGQSGLFKK